MRAHFSILLQIKFHQTGNGDKALHIIFVLRSNLCSRNWGEAGLSPH
jgi:hypothetical protein